MDGEMEETLTLLLFLLQGSKEGMFFVSPRPSKLWLTASKTIISYKQYVDLFKKIESIMKNLLPEAVNHA